MAGRQEAVHSKKLESALRSQEKFPINLEWMVDVFKYKHISSLTTHLKRHFKLNVHYKRFSQEQNKRVWTYFITVECFIGICEYVRHAARKKIANVWLRKVGVKGSNRRTPRDFEEEEYAEISDNNEIEDYEDDEQEEEIEEEYEEDNDNEYNYYYDKVNKNNNDTRKRRIEEDDEEYHSEEEEEDEDDTYYQEMEEEEAGLEYDSEDSVYESNTSSLSTPPSKIRRISSLSIDTHSYRDYPTALNISDGGYSSATSSSCSSPPSSPSLSPSSTPISLSSSSSSSSLTSSPSTSPSPSSSSLSSFRFLLNASNGVSSPSPLSLSSSGCIPPPSPALSSSVNYVQVPAKASVPATPQISEPLPEQDWSYLHLRPNNPIQSSSEISNKIPSSSPSSFVINNLQAYYNPQIVPYNYFFNPAAFYNYQPYLFSNLDHNSFGMKDSFHAEHSNVNLLGEERQFDTNMFLSIPEEHLFTFQS